jgi:predicted SprT family Zn-dependent metalloprotease
MNIHGWSKIAKDVYLLPYLEGKNQPGHEYIQEYENTRPYHRCKLDQPYLTEMVFRDNNEGPMYWCMGCGYTLEEGISMAIRLNEVEI